MRLIEEKLSLGLLTELNISPACSVYNLDLNAENASTSLRHYYDICKDDQNQLLVTTANFAEWKRGKFKNGHAKVIPAVPVDRGDNVRVFFFDDKISLHSGDSCGSSDSPGICNLRDTQSGNFVDFNDGVNGFQRDVAYSHTIIHHSSEYRNVLIQANILDAMSDVDYFLSIIRRYSEPGEQIIVYMDVNGTILWDDSVIGLSAGGLLLNTLFGFIKIRPHAPGSFAWGADKTVQLTTPQVLSYIVQSLGGDAKFFRDFWDPHLCCEFLRKLSELGEISWSLHGHRVDPDEFHTQYETYLAELLKQSNSGITGSWLRCFNEMRREGHKVVIMSFGVDSARVLPNSVTEPSKIPFLAVNFEQWDKNDVTKFIQQFRASRSPTVDVLPTMVPSGPAKPGRKSADRFMSGPARTSPGPSPQSGRKDPNRFMSGPVRPTGQPRKLASFQESDGSDSDSQSSDHKSVVSEASVD